MRSFLGVSMIGNSSTNPCVQIKDVVKSFPVGGGEITILKGISFCVNSGEFVSIVGPSGNGKSTLLNMITGIDRPSGGEVIVTGREVHRMSENQLAAAGMSNCVQFFQMLPALSLLQTSSWWTFGNIH
jgi:putative ABC transport system ATP-binding protein